MPPRARVSSLWPFVAVLAAAGCQGGGTSARGLDDSTYVRVMADLRRVHDERLAHPLPMLPPLRLPGQPPATEAERKVRDSTDAHRRDSVFTVDSLARLAVLTRARITAAQLFETARGLADDPARAQRVTEAIGRRAAQLDSVARRTAKQAAVDSGARASAEKIAGKAPTAGPRAP